MLKWLPLLVMTCILQIFLSNVIKANIFVFIWTLLLVNKYEHASVCSENYCNVSLKYSTEFVNHNEFNVLNQVIDYL